MVICHIDDIGLTCVATVCIYNAEIFLYEQWRPKGLQFEIIINDHYHDYTVLILPVHSKDGPRTEIIKKYTYLS